MVFIGYEKGTKAYRFFDPLTMKIHISRDTIFEEGIKWDWKANQGASDEGIFRFPTLPDLVIDALDQDPPIQIEFAVREDEGGRENSEEISSSQEGDQQRRFRSIQDLYDETEPVSYGMDVCLSSREEPTTYLEASKDQVWVKAMKEELDAIEKSATWELITPPIECRPIGLKWVFKIKKNSRGEVTRHNARLVAKGYSQRYGIDYEEVFTPVARFESIRVLMALAAQGRWELHHLDVKSAFLNGEIEEEIYVKQPEGFVLKGKEQCVFRLKKALYGLKQAPRVWYFKLDECLSSLGFRRSEHEHAVYFKKDSDYHLLIGVYVDDLIVTGPISAHIKEFKVKMMKLFEMSDLGLLNSYLGIEVIQGKSSICLNQRTYAMNILEHYNMTDCNLAHSPMEARLKFVKNEQDKC